MLEHGSASDVGYVAAAGLVPVALFLLAGGVLADRMSRRILMLGSDSLRALAEITLGCWILTQHPSLWGFMVLAALGWAVVIDGLTYLLSVLSLSLIKVSWVPSGSSDSVDTQSREGWHEFWSRTRLWVIVVEFSVVNILIFPPMFVLGPVVAKQSLGGAPAWGLILALEGAGALLGGRRHVALPPESTLVGGHS